MPNAVIETDDPALATPSGDAEAAAAERTTAPSSPRTGEGPWARFLAWAGGRAPSEYVTFAIVAGSVLFVFWQLQPKYLLSDTIPSGGDMSAHVWGPAYVRDHLLPHGRLTGWSPDWYAGFPAFHFYMVVPMLAIALLSYVIPYGIAFKLVAVSGVVAMPAAAWYLGRGSRMPFPVPALLSLGTLFFLFDRSFSITGGNIASTLAGEFNFSISLTFGVFYLGAVGSGLRTGGQRGLAALLLALCALCHPLVFFGMVAATAAWFVVRLSVATIRWFLTVVPVFLLAIAWWFGPFVTRSGYLNDMGWNKTEKYIQYLFLRDNLDNNLKQYPDWRVVLALAAVGLGLSLLLRVRGGVFLGVAATFTALFFRFAPQGRLWNERLLGFYMLAVYLLAATAIGLLLVILARTLADHDRLLARGIIGGGLVLSVVFSTLYIAMPMHSMPLLGCEESVMGTYRWGLGPLQLENREATYLKSWAKWNFEGLEGYETESEPTCETESGPTPPTYWRSYPEFQALIETLKRVGADHGCGRAMWEYEEDLNRYGSTMEPMMLPHFTDGCIGSMEGLYFEASATTPYHFINGTQLSKQGSTAQRDLPYATAPPNYADFDQGIQHLQLLGVRYYMAIDDSMKAHAGQHPSLTKVADSGPWSIYQVAGSDLVTPLRYEPAVITGEAATGHDWLQTQKCWYVNPESWDVLLAGDGPDSWQRVSRTYTPPEGATPQEQCSSPDGSAWGWYTGAAPAERELPPATVQNVVTGDDSISFDVDRTGVPVLVKMSYFPNWKVSGADEVYRVSPNLMVVVPTENHVELTYGYTGIEYVSYVLTLLGIVGLVVLFRAKPLEVKAPGRFWGRGERPDLYPPILAPIAPPAAAGDATWVVPPPPSGVQRTIAPPPPGSYLPGSDSPNVPEPGASPAGATEPNATTGAEGPDGPMGGADPGAAPAASDDPEGEAPGGDLPGAKGTDRPAGDVP